MFPRCACPCQQPWTLLVARGMGRTGTGEFVVTDLRRVLISSIFSGRSSAKRSLRVWQEDGRLAMYRLRKVARPGRDCSPGPTRGSGAAVKLPMATTYLGLGGVAPDSLEGGGSGGESRSPERSSQGGRTKAHGSRHGGCRCTGRGTGRESTDRWTGGRKQKKVVGAGRGQRKERKGGAKFGRADGWWTPEIADVNWLGVQLDAAPAMYRYGWEVLQRIKAPGHLVGPVRRAAACTEEARSPVSKFAPRPALLNVSSWMVTDTRT